MRDRPRARRSAQALLVAIVLLVAAGGAAWGHHLSGPCDIHRWKGEDVRHFSKRHIGCAVRTFGPVPGGKTRAICIAKRESGLFPDATSMTGLYLGLYQHAADQWPRRFKHWTKVGWQLPDKAVSGRTNAVVTIRMVHAARGWRKAGWPITGC